MTGDGAEPPGAVLRQSIGLGLKGGRFVPLLTRGSRLPASRTETFTTGDDYQAAIKMTLLAGDDNVADRNALLGEYEVSGFETGPRGIPQIEVTFQVGLDDVLQVLARDLATGTSVSVTRP